MSIEIDGKFAALTAEYERFLSRGADTDRPGRKTHWAQTAVHWVALLSGAVGLAGFVIACVAKGVESPDLEVTAVWFIDGSLVAATALLLLMVGAGLVATWLNLRNPRRHHKRMLGQATVHAATLTILSVDYEKADLEAAATAFEVQTEFMRSRIRLGSAFVGGVFAVFFLPVLRALYWPESSSPLATDGDISGPSAALLFLALLTFGPLMQMIGTRESFASFASLLRAASGPRR